MLLLIRVGFALYVLVLTTLLLAPDPLAAAGIEHRPRPLEYHVAHYLLFVGLSLAARACRWPLCPAVLIGLLAVYAVTLEVLQGPVPNRSVEIHDLVENLLGVATPFAVGWLVARWRSRS